MSAASVRTSGRRDNFPVFPREAGNKGDSGSFSKPLALRKVLIQELFKLVVHGKLLLFASFLFKFGAKTVFRKDNSLRPSHENSVPSDPHRQRKLRRRARISCIARRMPNATSFHAESLLDHRLTGIPSFGRA